MKPVCSRSLWIPALLGSLSLASFAQQPPSAGAAPSLQELQQQIARLEAELRAEREGARAREAERAAQLAALVENMRRIESQQATQAAQAAQIAAAPAGATTSGEASGFGVGGYGELHANLNDAPGEDVLDLHRFVLYLGYRFNDWIRLESEIEIEHGFVEGGEEGGEIAIEQLYADLSLNERTSLRIGRMLAPLGITNARHEPPTFNGVERPSLETFIIPSTWSQDGIGLVGSWGERWSYQAFVTTGLDGSEFDSFEGLRGGRHEGFRSLNDPALSGRVDFRPYAISGPAGHDARFGLGAYTSGLDNGEEGEDTGAPGRVDLFALDGQYRVGDWEAKSVLAFGQIHDAEALNAQFGNDVGSELGGGYLELGYHWFPERWREGKLAAADATVFARYESFDTQLDKPDNAAADPRAEREELTLGLNFWPTQNFVLKLDYQLRDDDTNEGLDAFNIGLGWQF